MLSISSPTNGSTVGHQINVAGTCSSKHTVSVNIGGGITQPAQPNPTTGNWSVNMYCQPTGHQKITASCTGETPVSVDVTVQ